MNDVLAWLNNGFFMLSDELVVDVSFYRKEYGFIFCKAVYMASTDDERFVNSSLIHSVCPNPVFVDTLFESV